MQLKKRLSTVAGAAGASVLAFASPAFAAVDPSVTQAGENITAVTGQLGTAGTALAGVAGTLIGVALLLVAVKAGMKVFRRATGA